MNGDNKIHASQRVRQPSTGRVGKVVDVNHRKRPPKAMVLFDGDASVDAVWITLSSLIPES